MGKVIGKCKKVLKLLKLQYKKTKIKLLQLLKWKLTI